MASRAYQQITRRMKRRDGKSTGVIRRNVTQTATVEYIEGRGFVTTTTYRESMNIEKVEYDK